MSYVLENYSSDFTLQKYFNYASIVFKTSRVPGTNEMSFDIYITVNCDRRNSHFYTDITEYKDYVTDSLSEAVKETLIRQLELLSVDDDFLDYNENYKIDINNFEI